MAVTSVKSQGTTVYVYDAGDSYVEVDQVTDLNGLGGQAGTIDATHFGSSAKEKDVSLPDEGQCTIECVYNPADTGQIRMMALYTAQTIENFKVTLTDDGAQEATFEGFVVGRQVNIPKDEIVRMTFTVEISGAVAWS